MKLTHICLPVFSQAEFYYPDAFSIDLEVLDELKPLVEIAQRLNETVRSFRQIEFDWPYGTWLTIDENIDATPAVFQEQDPSESDWATDYNDLAPVEGVSVRTNGHYIEFRCYEADTGLESWTAPIYWRGDQIVYSDRLAYNMLTGEVTEVDNVQ